MARRSALRIPKTQCAFLRLSRRSPARPGGRGFTTVERGSPRGERVIRLVVNADDLGLHPQIDQGILRAHREGIVTSATVLATGSNARAAIAAARSQGLALGVHLCLTTRLPPAAPVDEVRSLAPDGRF